VEGRREKNVDAEGMGVERRKTFTKASFNFSFYIL
jgi:hypothetical protein